MDELRHDAQVHAIDHAPRHETATSPDRCLASARAPSPVNLTNLSALLVVFLDRAQLHSAVSVDPNSHIYLRW